MKPKPCEYCGAHYHQPYEEGLVECRENVRFERDRLEWALREILVGRTSADEDNPLGVGMSMAGRFIEIAKSALTKGKE